MGILPDWLGEGGFVTVSGNPSPDVQSLSYAPTPPEVQELTWQA